MKKIIILFIILLYACASADFLLDKSIKGTVTRAQKYSIVASQLDADSNGAYQNRTIVFGGTNKNIQYDMRVVLNFFASNDSLVFDPLLIAPTVGDSFWVIPILSYDMADTAEVAEAVKQRILTSPYNKITVDADGRVTTLADILLGAGNGWYLRYYPSSSNPKDSAQVVNPSLGADSIMAVIKLFKNQNVTHEQKFELK